MGVFIRNQRTGHLEALKGKPCEDRAQGSAGLCLGEAQDMYSHQKMEEVRLNSLQKKLQKMLSC